jgi:hypothetical protein
MWDRILGWNAVARQSKAVSSHRKAVSSHRTPKNTAFLHITIKHNGHYRTLRAGSPSVQDCGTTSDKKSYVELVWIFPSAARSL